MPKDGPSSSIKGGLTQVSAHARENIRTKDATHRPHLDVLGAPIGVYKRAEVLKLLSRLDEVSTGWVQLVTCTSL